MEQHSKFMFLPLIDHFYKYVTLKWKENGDGSSEEIKLEKL